jgi:hypothetical protein
VGQQYQRPQVPRLDDLLGQRRLLAATRAEHLADSPGTHGMARPFDISSALRPRSSADSSPALPRLNPSRTTIHGRKRNPAEAHRPRRAPTCAQPA